MKLSIGEAKARLLEYGHRPRGPKAAIRRDPVTAAAVAFFIGVIISRFRPGPLLPLGALLSKPLLQRLLPVIGRFAIAKVSGRMQGKARGMPIRRPAPTGAQHRPYQARPFSPPGAVGRSYVGEPGGGHPGEWAFGPQREGFTPPQARSRHPQERQS